MTRDEWKLKLQQDFTGDNDADIRMRKNRITDSKMWTDGNKLRWAALKLIAVLQSQG